MELHVQVIDHEYGYWVKFECWEVTASDVIPHGIRYSLILHTPNGKRILGYDNAHAVKPKGKRFSGQRLTFDHKHRHVADKGVPYVFKDAHQFMSDFLNEVDTVLEEVKSK